MTTQPDAPRLLVVVAHPDDETFGCGSLLMHSAATGMSTSVLCATRGEAGERVDGTPEGDLGAIREAETRAAATVLGVDTVHFLDYRDSGMSGAAAGSTLAGAALADVRDDVAGVLRSVRPTVVVTLDGSDGHRDHQRIREATLAAIGQAGTSVERVYLHCLPQSLMRRWVEHMASTDPSWEHLRHDVPGTPDDQITTELNTTEYLDRREQAIAVHASQRSPFDGLPNELRRAFLMTDQLRRVLPQWPGGPRETSLLAEQSLPHKETNQP